MMNDNRSELNEKKEAQMEIASQRGRFSVTPYKTRERFPVPLNTQAPGMAWVFFCPPSPPFQALIEHFRSVVKYFIVFKPSGTVLVRWRGGIFTDRRHSCGERHHLRRGDGSFCLIPPNSTSCSSTNNGTFQAISLT